MDAQENSRSSILPSSLDKRIPIYGMMPVDAFCIDGTGRPRIRKIKALTVALKALKLAGVHKIAVEVWWGIVERFSPPAYDWSLYEGLFKLISDSGLKLHVALSFHSNVNSSSSRKGGVTLPLWIIEIGDQNKHIYYRDQNGFSNDDYLTLGVDHVPLFCCRTALQCYEDFLSSFAKKFESLIGTVIEDFGVGLGCYCYTRTTSMKPVQLFLMQHCYIAHTDILHILLVMVDGSFLESVNSSAMTSA